MSRREGQVVKRGEGKFLIRWSVGADSATGKYRHKSRTIHGTKRDAERALRQILRSRDTGEYVEPSKETLDVYLTCWLDSVSSRLSPRTHRDYGRILDAYVRPHIGDFRLEQLRRSHVQELVDKLARTPKRMAKSPAREKPKAPELLSARTVRLAHVILHGALKDAVREDRIPRNAAELVRLPRQERNEMTALTSEQVAALRTEFKGNPYAALIDFLLGTGCRPGEALGLRWEDLDLQAPAATIRQALSINSDGRPAMKEPKTAGSRRRIPLPPSLVGVLREHKRTQSAHALKLGAAYDRTADLVFPNEAGAPLELRNVVQRHFKPTLVRAGIPRTVRIYDLRHTHATALLAAGIHPKVAAERLGHTTTRQTLDTYSHVLPGMQSEATKRIEESLFG